MKLSKFKHIAATAWKHFKFDTGKKAKILYIVFHGDFQLVGGEFCYLFANGIEIPATPTPSIAYDVMYSKHKSITTEGAAVDETWKVFDLRFLEIESIGPEYFVSVYNGSATPYDYQVDVIFDKQFIKQKR